MQRAAEEGSGFLEQETREKVQDIETRMEEIIQMCEQQACARPRHTDCEEAESLKEVKRRWHKWALTMHEQNAYIGSRSNDSRVRIERTMFPSFDRNHKNWPEFTRVFKA